MNAGRPRVFADNRIARNRATGDGGGVWFGDSLTPVTLVRNCFEDNEAVVGGGLNVRDVEMIGCVIAGNRAGRSVSEIDVRIMTATAVPQ